MSCYITCHVMFYDICSEQNMLYNMCHVMLYNICHVMLCDIPCVILCYITCVMLCYMTYVQDRNKQIRTCFIIYILRNTHQKAMS